MKKICTGTGILLLVPLIAMQFTEEVSWTLVDFEIAAVLLISAGYFIVTANRFLLKSPLRVPVIAFILICLIVFWAELAVGIFDSPLAGD